MTESAGMLEPDVKALEYSDLTIAYGPVNAVAGVGIAIEAGEVVGLVGESGCGKSSLAGAALRYLRGRGRIVDGAIRVQGTNLLDLSVKQLDRLRGDTIGFVPQNPSQALAPHRRINGQLKDLLDAHGIACDAGERKRIAANLFDQVELPNASSIGRRFPHQLSGGQQQRVCIALALACLPTVLVLDEPTTGLDTTTQQQIIALLERLRSETRVAMLYVTHDLAVLSTIADRIAVMYAGYLVEVGDARTILERPEHPYTRGLVSSVPMVDDNRLPSEPLTGALRRSDLPPGCAFQPRCRYAKPACRETRQFLRLLAPDRGVACERAPLARSAAPAERIHRRHETGRKPVVLEARELSVRYGVNVFSRYFDSPLPAALTPTSLSLHESEVLAVVGESGSGKSTLARALVGLTHPESGEVYLDSTRQSPGIGGRSTEAKKAIQFVFQNPDASLNPRQTIGEIVSRQARQLLGVGRRDGSERAKKELGSVGLDSSFLSRYPDELSGGERQRVAIARALVVEPRVLICDEILSALDVSVQAGILGLLERLREETGVAMLFISHDLAVVRRLADRVAVLYCGRVVEEGETAELFAPPIHPYTEMLLNAAPRLALDGARRLSGEPAVPRRPSMSSGSSGCPFFARCPISIESVCDRIEPPNVRPSGTHMIACHSKEHESVDLQTA